MLSTLFSICVLLFSSSPIGGTLPGRRSKNKPIKDSGSSGPDRDKSSGSRKSERTKSRERIARKPSKELLRIQNFSDSSDEDFRLTARKEFQSIKRRGSKYSDSRSPNDQSLQAVERKEEKLVTDGASSKTDIASSVSPSSSKRSPNISRQSPKKSSRKSRHSPETQRKKTPPPPPTKSLNMQIKEFIKHSSPPKTRKISESSNSNFDAFNHTSSSKLSHSFSKEHEKSPSSSSKQGSFSQPYSGLSYDDYEYYHPRRSSKEVLDFTSSRKCLDNNRSGEIEQAQLQHQRKQAREDRGYRTDESHYKRKDELRQCQCPSPRARSPPHEREEKEVFDFTSKKLSQLSTATLGRKSRGKDSKVDITRKDVEIHSSSPLVKSPRRKEERNVFDFSVADGSEYATLRKRKSGKRREGFTSGSDRERREVLDFTSERRDILDFTSTSRLDASSANTSQELLNLKSSSEFLVCNSGSREMIQVRQPSEDKAIDPWPESSHLSLPRQKSDTNNEEFLQDNSTFRKVDFKTEKSFSPSRDTIEPPDLFNPSKQCGPSSEKCEENYEEEIVSHRKGGTLKHRYQCPLSILWQIVLNVFLTTSHKQRSKRIRNRSLEMVLDDFQGDNHSKSR